MAESAGVPILTEDWHFRRMDDLCSAVAHALQQQESSDNSLQTAKQALRSSVQRQLVSPLVAKHAYHEKVRKMKADWAKAKKLAVEQTRKYLRQVTDQLKKNAGDHCQEQINALRYEKQSMQNAKDLLSQDQLAEALNELQHARALLKQGQADTDIQVTQLGQDLAERNAKIVALTQSSAALQQNIMERNADLASVKAQLSNRDVKLLGMGQSSAYNMQRLQQEVATRNANIAAMKLQLNSLGQSSASNMQRLQQEVAARNDSLAAMKAQLNNRDGKLLNLGQSSASNVERLQKEIATRNANIAAMKLQLNSLGQSSASNMQRLQKEVATRNDSLAALKAQLNNRDVKLLGMGQSSASNMERLQKEVATRNANIAAMKLQLNSLGQSSASNMQRLQQEVAARNDSLAAMKAQLNNRDGKLLGLGQSSAANMERLQKEIAARNDSLAAMKAQLNNRDVKLLGLGQSSASNMERLQKEIAARNDSLAAMKAQLNNRDVKLLGLGQSSASNMQRLQQEIAARNDSLAAMKAQLNNRDGKLLGLGQSSASNIQRLQQEIAARNDSLAAMKAQLNNRDGKLLGLGQSSASNMQRLQQQVASRNANLAAAQAQVQHYESMHAQLVAAADAHAQQQAAQAKDLQLAVQEREALKRQADEFSAQVAADRATSQANRNVLLRQAADQKAVWNSEQGVLLQQLQQLQNQASANKNALAGQQNALVKMQSNLNKVVALKDKMVNASTAVELTNTKAKLVEALAQIKNLSAQVLALQPPPVNAGLPLVPVNNKVAAAQYNDARAREALNRLMAFPNANFTSTMRNLRKVHANKSVPVGPLYPVIAKHLARLMGQIFVNVIRNSFESSSFKVRADSGQVNVADRARLLEVSAGNAHKPVVSVTSLAEDTVGALTRATYGPFYTVSDMDANHHMREVYDAQASRGAGFRDQALLALSGGSVVQFAYGFSGSGKTTALLGGRNMVGLLQCMVETVRTRGGDVKWHMAIEQYGLLHAEARTDTSQAGKNMGRTKPISLRRMTQPQLTQLNCPVGKSIPSDTNQLANEIERICEKRHTASTPNNPESSRSHLYLVLKVEATPNTGSPGYMTFVDMGGIEDPMAMAAELVQRTQPLKPVADVNGKVFSEALSYQLPKWQGTKVSAKMDAGAQPVLRQNFELLQQGFYITQTLYELAFFFKYRALLQVNNTAGRASLVRRVKEQFSDGGPARLWKAIGAYQKAAPGKAGGYAQTTYSPDRSFVSGAELQSMYTEVIAKNVGQTTLNNTAPGVSLEAFVANPSLGASVDATKTMTIVNALSKLGDGPCTFAMVAVVNPYVAFNPSKAATETLQFAEAVTVK